MEDSNHKVSFQIQIEDQTHQQQPVWPVKNHQMSIKVAQNDLTRKMNAFDTFTKNYLTMWAIWVK